MELPDEIRTFIQDSTGNYGKVKLVLHRNKFWVESPYPDILRTLLKVWAAGYRGWHGSSTPAHGMPGAGERPYPAILCTLLKVGAAGY